jgi:ribose 5-phosphate isomerase
MSVDAQKRAAAEFAAGLVEKDTVVGLGSGSTAELAVHALGRRKGCDSLACRQVARRS